MFPLRGKKPRSFLADEDPQLCHAKAAEIRRRFDTEAAQVILGRSKPESFVNYAERNLAGARQVMTEVG